MPMFCIDDKLCGSSRLTDKDCPALTEQGIRAIVSLRRSAVETDSCLRRNFRFKQIPVGEAGPFCLLLPKILSFLHFLRSTDGRVLAFCLEGCNRTCTFLACYLVAERDFTPNDAINAMKDNRRCAFKDCSYLRIVERFARFHHAWGPMKLLRIFI